MIRLSHLLGLILVLFVLDADGVCGITVRFHPQAKVSGSFILLGDIAEVSGGTPENIATYQHARLAPSPPRGGHVYLDFDTVRNRLRALGLSTAGVNFTGRSQIHVRTTGGGPRISDAHSGSNSNKMSNANQLPTLNTINQAERLAASVVHHALKPYTSEADLTAMELEIQIAPDDAHTMIGTTSDDWTVSGWSANAAQNHHLTLTPKETRPERKPLQITCRIKLPPKALAVREPLPIGHILGASDLVSIRSWQPNVISRREDVVGMETLHSLIPGNPIQQNDVRSKPYVRSRDIVNVAVRLNGITVTTRMRALATGGLGETIPLSTPDGREKIFAKVTGYHEAEVMESSESQAAN